MFETGRNDIDTAISIEVAEGAAAMTSGGGVGETRFAGKRLPFAVRALIAEDGVGLGKFVSWRPHRRHASSRHEEVLPSIIVEVVESRAESGHCHAGRQGARRGEDDPLQLLRARAARPRRL